MEEKKYTLEELYRKGLISPCIINYREINDKIRQLVATRMKRGEAVRKVADELGITVQTVYNSLKVKI